VTIQVYTDTDDHINSVTYSFYVAISIVYSSVTCNYTNM